MKTILIIVALLFPFSASANQPTLQIPSDAKAKYVVIQNKKIGDLSILQTIRKGSSGVSFSTRLFNCQNGTFKYLVDVDGKVNADVFLQKNNIAMETLDESNMSAITQGSISYYAYKYSCK